MSSGTFAYQLGFTAMLVAIGLMVLPRSDHGRPASNASEPATANKSETTETKAPLNFKIAAKLIERCDEFIRKYPDAKTYEDVATVSGEIRLERGLVDDWKEAGKIYRDLEARFPKSKNLDRYVYIQAIACFQLANFEESSPIFARFLDSFPHSELVENAMYYAAMSKFLSANYEETLASCKDLLAKFPHGQFAGDMAYRIAFIDFNDKDEDQSERVIRNLTGFIIDHPDDATVGSMLCLIGDANRKIEKTDAAIEAYKKAVETKSPDDVIQYALNECTFLLQGKKDWAAISELHRGFAKRMPDSPLALFSTTWVARMMAREGKAAEAAEFLVGVLKHRIGDPASEQVEFLIDEIVKSLVPRKKTSAINADEIDKIDKQLQDILSKVIAGHENPTTTARIYYARARLAQLLKRTDRSDLYLKGIATTNARNPSVLSPALLASSGDILLKTEDLEGAEAMYRRLADKYKESVFSDAGPVGLGYVALARKDPEGALKIFDAALESNAGTSRFKECTLGKLQALVDLGKFEPAQNLALQIAGDKSFRGEAAAKAYMLLARSCRMQAVKAASISKAASKELFGKAHGYYQRVYLTTLGFPDICAEAYWQAHETAKEMGDEKLAQETLKALATQLKLKNTKRAAKAAEMIK